MLQFSKLNRSTVRTHASVLTRMPVLEDFYGMWSRAFRSRGEVQALTWIDVYGARMTLQLKAMPGRTEPVWTLFKGEGVQSKGQWTHPSCDVLLIYSLIADENAEGGLEERANKQTLTAAASKNRWTSNNRMPTRAHAY